MYLPNPGHPTDANFVGEEYLTATVVDNDLPPGETLYNGIELPYVWPPRYPSIPYSPMPVPYLDAENIPNPIIIDVGRQLFVDDFLIETTDMTQTYHQADYYAGNPVLAPTTASEVCEEGNWYAGPFSGGSWYDPAENLFKLFYRGGLRECLAFSTDGKNWTRPNLTLNPIQLLDHFTCSPSNPTVGQTVTITAYDQYNQQVDLGDYDIIEFCFYFGQGCISTYSGITIVGGAARFTATSAMINNSVSFQFEAYNSSGPPYTESFSMPFPFNSIARGGNEVYNGYDMDSCSVFLDLNAPASERFKWFASELTGQGILFTYRKSADGETWSAPQGERTDCWGDRTTAMYNPFRDVWICSQRTEDSSGRATRAYTEGTSALDLMSKVEYNDLTNVYGESVQWVGADNLDPHHTDPEWNWVEPGLYNLDGQAYESIMIGQFSIWQGPPNGICDDEWIQKRNDILLGFSRDGFHWDRPDRNRFIACTWDDLSWRFGNVQSCVGSPLVVGDELYFYFNGRPKPEPTDITWDADFHTGLAILRRDGFASMDASGSAKTLTTRPVSFSGRYLFVNVDCPSGSLKVEVLNEAGEVISPFTLANCDAISSDTTCKQITWGANDDLTALAGTKVRFRFTLTDGSLYAFWVSPDASGASYGYVGGGGPGFTGPRDTVGQQECGGANLDDISDEINTADLAIVAAHWLFDCTAPDWCSGADMDPAVENRGSVNLTDFVNLARYWLETNCY